MESISIKELPAGSKGFTDPWNLAELKNVVKPIPPDLEANAPPPPAPPSERSGVFWLWGDGRVFGKPTETHTIPIAKDAQERLSVDLTGLKLNHAPRLESSQFLDQGGYKACTVVGLDEALQSPPPVTAESEEKAPVTADAKPAANQAKPATKAPAGAQATA